VPNLLQSNLDSQSETLAGSITTINANAAANDATAATDAATNDDVTRSPCDVGLRSPNWLRNALASVHPSQYLPAPSRPQCLQSQRRLERHLSAR
jgi:hypothetical protein